MKDLVRFKHRQNSVDQMWITRNAQCDFLQRTDLEAAFHQQILAKKDDDLYNNTILENPSFQNTQEHGEGNVSAVPDPPPNFNTTGVQTSSPANSVSNKSETVGCRFQKAKEKITKALDELESNDSVHTESPENNVKQIEKWQKDIKVQHIILLCEAEPDLNKQYGGTA